MSEDLFPRGAGFDKGVALLWPIPAAPGTTAATGLVGVFEWLIRSGAGYNE